MASAGPVATAAAATFAKPHAYPNFYACYLLRSLKKRYESRTYVGSTPNPARRIRQHNGELTAGARKTARYRPWEMVCIVHGFPSQLAALQFEWAWQNPHMSRQMPVSTKQALHRTRKDGNTSPGQRRKGGKGGNRRLRPSLTMAGKLANMHTMLTLDAWKKWPLSVKIFNEDVWTIWNKHIKKKGVTALPSWITAEFNPKKYLPPVDDKAITEIPVAPIAEVIEPIPIGRAKKPKKPPKSPKRTQTEKKTDTDVPIKTSGGVINLDLLDHPLQNLQANKLSSLQSLSNDAATCNICAEQLAVSEQRKFLVCSSCDHISHVACMAATFLQNDTETLLPSEGNCPSCGTTLRWGPLIKGAHFRHLLKTKGIVADNEDEFADLEMDGQDSEETLTITESETSSDSETPASRQKVVSKGASRSKSPTKRKSSKKAEGS